MQLHENSFCCLINSAFSLNATHWRPQQYSIGRANGQFAYSGLQCMMQPGDS